MVRLKIFVICLTASCQMFAGGEITRLKSSLTKLRQNHPAAAEEIRPGSKAIDLIKKMDPQQPWEVHLVVAEWFFRAHMLQSRFSAQEVGVEQDFLNSAWTRAFIASEAALNGRSFMSTVVPGQKTREDTPKEMQETITWLCTEISVRLGDPVKMSQGLRIFELKPSTDSRTQTFAMMAAFHTGKWELASRLGKDLVANPKILPALHEQSSKNIDIFDYSSLLQWIDKTQPTPFLGALEVKKITLKDFKYRSKKLESASTTEIYNAKATVPSEWTSIPTKGNLLSINGAVAHWLKPFGHRTPLSGALTSDRLSLYGYVDQGGKRYVDSLELRIDPERKKIWVGTLISQDPDRDGLIYHFDVEAELD